MTVNLAKRDEYLDRKFYSGLRDSFSDILESVVPENEKISLEIQIPVEVRDSDNILISLSGGVDSMVLCHILVRLRKQYGFRIHAA